MSSRLLTDEEMERRLQSPPSTDSVPPTEETGGDASLLSYFSPTTKAVDSYLY